MASELSAISSTASPAGAAAIPVRHPRFDLGPALPRHWCRGEPFATHVLDALSSVFPVGEAFFVRSVVHYASEVERDGGPELARAVRGFAGQEARHSHEHDRHVDLLIASGYPALATRNRWADVGLRWSNRRTPRLSLAATAALEHLTALLARAVLTQREQLERDFDPRMVRLWQWHALEEAEHKAVAFDVLRLVSRREHALRAFSLLTQTTALVLETLDRVVYMLWKDGELFRAKTWRDGFRFLFEGANPADGEGARPRGFLRGFGPGFRAWFRSDFHPDEIDDRALIEEWRREFAGDARGR